MLRLFTCVHLEPTGSLTAQFSRKAHRIPGGKRFNARITTDCVFRSIRDALKLVTMVVKAFVALEKFYSQYMAVHGFDLCYNWIVKNLSYGSGVYASLGSSILESCSSSSPMLPTRPPLPPLTIALTAANLRLQPDAIRV